MKFFSHRLSALSSAGVFLLCTACHQAESKPGLSSREVTSEITFRMYHEEEPENLNYLKSDDERQDMILANVIDCLVEYDSYGNVIPALAESWTYNDDMSTWTFQIRPGVQWVDYQGNVYAEVTSSDWVAAVEYINNAENASEQHKMYVSDAVIRNAQEYYAYTNYLLEEKNEKIERAKSQAKNTGTTDEPEEESEESDAQETEEKEKEKAKNKKTESEEDTEETTETRSDKKKNTEPEETEKITETDKYGRYYEVTEEADTQETTKKIHECLPRDIGVEAADRYTLIYKLDNPCPYFLDILCDPAFMPVNRQYLEDTGNKFGCDYQHLLYNGAYFLSEATAQEQTVFSRNTYYWDKQNIYIDKIESLYHTGAIQENDFLNHTVDIIPIASHDLSDWMQDEETKDLIHPAQPDNSCSYFYLFNFCPEFNEKYEPENWEIAVNNENFRHAVIHAINRLELLSLYDSYKPERFISNTITPKEFTFGAGTDYTQYDALRTISGTDSYAPAQAQEYRDIAREELTASGAVFPIKMLMSYQVETGNEQQEYTLLKNQIESTLGQDFIQVELLEDKGGNARQNGRFAFMKCSVTATYIDPQAWTEPFLPEQDYIRWDRSENRTTNELFTSWQEKITEAVAIYNDAYRRYTAFAEAEQMLLEHAVVMPCSTRPNGYVIARLTPFEAEYDAVGIASQKLKFCRLSTTSAGMSEYERLHEQWKDQRRRNIK